MKPKIFKLLGIINLAYLLALAVLGFVPFFLARGYDGSADGVGEGLSIAILAVLGIILGIGAAIYFVLQLINYIISIKKPSIGAIVYTCVLIAALVILIVSSLLSGGSGDGSGLFFGAFIVVEIAYLVYELVYLIRARKRIKAEHPITYTTYIQ